MHLCLSNFWIHGNRSVIAGFVLYQLMFIHSFIQAISIAPFQVHLKSLLTQHGYCVEFHTEASQTTVSEGLAQGPYVAARAGFEPATLQTKGVEPTNEPPCPTCYIESPMCTLDLIEHIMHLLI